ncbi:hypothetical protein FXW07_11295 [Methanosarcina sp. DH1]|uniref:sirohydrochlorin chelatase n=1 Tax=Methanosarcina sp. DH1 TaxID=2605695 RepID=UPI001E5C8391|nr:CbiX/SirB N-terminal domain-containing protein [Methanosarcina sp. DH1]MCC4767187.1 hypothetical protein [Methanosarcina sp. DH1]
MVKTQITLSTQWQLRRILTMLLTVAVVISLLPATAYAYDSAVENCSSTTIINCASENASDADIEKTGVLSPTTGILVVAHGSPEDEWNQPVRDAVESIDCPYPIELGFLEYVEGEDIGTAVSNLEEQGVEHIITVPIFVASASDHIEEIKYILGISSIVTI